MLKCRKSCTTQTSTFYIITSAIFLHSTHHLDVTLQALFKSSTSRVMFRLGIEDTKATEEMEQLLNESDSEDIQKLGIESDELKKFRLNLESKERLEALKSNERIKMFTLLNPEDRIKAMKKNFDGIFLSTIFSS